MFCHFLVENFVKRKTAALASSQTQKSNRQIVHRDLAESDSITIVFFPHTNKVTQHMTFLNL